MMGHMLLGVATFGLLILGFAYIVLVLANKENGLIKVLGQVIAGLIVLALVTGLVYGIMVKPKMHCPMMKKNKMMEGRKMHKMMGTVGTTEAKLYPKSK